MSEHHISETPESLHPRARPEPPLAMLESETSDLQRRRQRALNLSLGIAVVGGLSVLIPSLMRMMQDPGQVLVEWPMLIAYAVVVGAFVMRQLDYYLRLAVLVVAVYLFGSLSVQVSGVTGPGVWYLLLGPALLFPLGGWRIGLFALVFSALVYVGLGVTHYQGWMSMQLPDPTEIGSLLYFGAMYLLVLLLIGAAQGIFNRAQEETLQAARQRVAMLQESRQQSQRQVDELASANHRLQRQSRQFHIAAEVVAATRGITTLDALSDRVVELIHHRLADMDVTSVGLYMYEGARSAEQRADTGHRLRLRAVSEKGDASSRDASLREQRVPTVVSKALYTQAARIARDPQNGARQLALPLRFWQMAVASDSSPSAGASGDGGRGLRAEGAIFLQSTAPEAFREVDLDVWQVLADQLAGAFQNVLLLQQARRQVREMQRLYQVYDQEIWQREAEQRKVFRYAQGETDEDVESEASSEAMRQAVRDRRLVVDQDAREGRAHITVPVTVRDAVVGVMHIEKSGARARWSESQVDLVRMINEQLELALDSARLFEDTQKRAARERLVGDISSQMRAATNLEDMLRTAVQELGQRLALDEVVLELRPDPGAQSRSE